MTLTVEKLMAAAKLLEGCRPYASIACNERMVPDGRLIAPPPGAAFQGIPIHVRPTVPDGYLILLDGRGEVVGVVGPAEPKGDSQ